MDPNQENQSPAGNNQPPHQEGIDPRSLILPNKEVHDPLNAQRVSAGVLAEQEATATLPKAPPAPPPIPKAPSEDLVRPLETYQDDVQRYVRQKNVSTVTVAAAEEAHRKREATPINVEPARKTNYQLVAMVSGVVLVVAALGGLAGAYIYSRPLPQQQNPIAPYIAVDAVVDIPITPDATPADTMSLLGTAKSQVHQSVGLITQLRLWVATTTGQTLLPAQAFLSLWTPHIPPQLLRTIQPDFLMGIHSFDVNQPFVIFSVDNYQGGYAGMLDWEPTLAQDVSPYFAYTPSPHGATATSSTDTQVLASPFVDDIIENHDARVIKNQQGDVILLWTFLDRSTVLVTTNPDTVKEVVSRLNIAPHLPQVSS